MGWPASTCFNLLQPASACISLRTRRCRASVLRTSGTMTMNPGWNVGDSLLVSSQICRGHQQAQQAQRYKKESHVPNNWCFIVFHPWRSSHRVCLNLKKVYFDVMRQTWNTKYLLISLSVQEQVQLSPFQWHWMQSFNYLWVGNIQSAFKLHVFKFVLLDVRPSSTRAYDEQHSVSHLNDLFGTCWNLPWDPEGMHFGKKDRYGHAGSPCSTWWSITKNHS